MNIEKTIRKIIKENISNDPKLDTLTLDDKIAEWGINSFLYIKLIVYIEQEFDIDMNDDLSFADIVSLRSIIDKINEYIPAE